MTTLATRIAHDHQPTPTGCTCGKRLIGGKCARGSLVPFVEHVAEVTQEKVAAEIEASIDPQRRSIPSVHGLWPGMEVAADIARSA